MKTIGEVLAQARQNKNMSQPRLAQVTSVPLQYIEHLENQAYDQLPSRSLVKGYVQLLAAALEIPEETALALFRRDFPKKTQANKNADQAPKRTPLALQPQWRGQMVSIISIAVVFLVVTSILLAKWQQLGRPPNLTVQNLENHDLVESPLTISGQTDTDATLTINTEIISLDPQGKFQYLLELPAGERSIVIQARDAQGRLSEEVFFVTVE